MKGQSPAIPHAESRQARRQVVRDLIGAGRLGMGAREWFASNRIRRLAATPKDKHGHPTGPSTFRNVIDENGKHV